MRITAREHRRGGRAVSFGTSAYSIYTGAAVYPAAAAAYGPQAFFCHLSVDRLCDLAVDVFFFFEAKFFDHAAVKRFDIILRVAKIFAAHVRT